MTIEVGSLMVQVQAQTAPFCNDIIYYGKEKNALAYSGKSTTTRKLY